MVDSDAVAWARGRFPGLHAVGPGEAALLSAAVEARLSGDYARAAEQYLVAAKEADDDADQRHHQLRAVGAMMLDGQVEAAGELIDQVTAAARTAFDTESLTDALGMSAGISVMADRVAEGFEALAEAVHLSDQLDDHPAVAVVIGNTGLALTHYGLVEESQGFHRRAAELAPAPDLRCWSLAQLTTCFTVLASDATDESVRAAHAGRGVEIASEVINLDGGGDRYALALARANRSVLHALTGRHREAAADAVVVLESTAPAITTELEAIALTGSVLARWGLERDGSVVEDCQRIVDLASPRQVDHCIDLVVSVHVEALGAAGPHDDLRGVLDEHLTRLRRLRDRHHELERAHIRLGLAHHRAEALTEIDPLTGLHNRRYLDRFVGDLVAAPKAGDATPGCVAVIDLDGFKPVNDEYGYATGDSVLRELAIELRQQCRRADGLARLGGDEFVVVLPGTSPDTARPVLDRIRAAVAARRWTGLPTTLGITTSIGFTMVVPGTETNVLIDEASQAMQQAKRSGRDQVVAWVDIEHRTPDRRRG